jgi:hypothetical protein
MIVDSQQTVHKAISFMFSSFAGFDKRASLKFQGALLERGVDFSSTQEGENTLTIIREKPARLEIHLNVPGPAIGNLLIAGPHGAHSGEMFEHEAEAVVLAFNDVWYDANRQILSCEASVRDLFESSYEHAFRELWEFRLSQRDESLVILGRPVLGGGIRLVMPPLPGEERPCQIELKIESYLRDTKKIFVDTQFSWPTVNSGPMDPPARLKIVDEYVENHVIPFILGRSNAGEL